MATHKFDSLSSLDRHIRDCCSGPVKDTIEKKIKKTINTHAKKVPKSNRYPKDSFSGKPLSRSRKIERYGYIYTGYVPRSSGGIDDIDQIITQSDVFDKRNFSMVVSGWNEAPPNTPIFPPKRAIPEHSTIFSQWINDGQWMDLKEYLRLSHEYWNKRHRKLPENMKPKRKARPFIDDAIREIETCVTNSESSFMKKLHSEIVK